MPSPQPILSHNEPSSNNGTPKASNTLEPPLTNGHTPHSSNASHTNGTPTEASNGARTPDAMEEAKRKARATLNATGLLTESTGNKRTSPEEPSGGQTNGATQTQPVSGRKPSPSRVQKSRTPPRSGSRRSKDEAQKVLLEQYVQRDLLHSAAMIVDKYNQNDIIRSKVNKTEEYKKYWAEKKTNPAAIFGHGYAGFGNGDTNVPTGGPSRILLPSQRKRPAGRKTRELRVARKDVAAQAEQLDELVPIRLDIEWDKIRLRDTFTWNIHDRTIPLDLFADSLVEDFKLPLDQCQPLAQRVHASVHEQIQDFHPQIMIEEEALDPHLPYNAYKDDEMRITVKLNITISQYTLIDQFEWDLNNPINMAEEFARQMSRDLSLSGEFTTAIAHSIREQSQLFTRSLYATGHPFDGRPVEDQELKDSFLPSPLPSSFRPFQAAKEYTPYLYELNEADLERTELSLSREERRQKRSVNRRGGPVLPDLKDRRSTIRTLVVSSVIPGAAPSIEDSRLFKRTGAASGKNRRNPGQKDGLDDSDESDSDDSSPDSPAIPAHLLAGTARTRGMRGAASAAQAAMRANLGRSITPELSSLHHHETRTSGRRFGGKEFREESIDDVPPPASLILKLRIAPDKIRRFVRNLDAGKSKRDTLAVQGQLSAQRSQSGTPKSKSAASASSMPPPPPAQASTPTPTPTQLEQMTAQEAALQQDSPAKSSNKAPGPASQVGRVDARGPPSLANPIVSVFS